MRKIETIFDRDWEGTRGVVPKLLHNPGGAIPTEKIDGTNVRVTVRNHRPVRVEKRRNPSKQEKADGIVEPWYRDADPDDPGDKYLWAATLGGGYDDVPDGEWSGEVFGEKVQGNPLDVEGQHLLFFDLRSLPVGRCVPVLEDVPQAPETLGTGARRRQAPDYFSELRGYIEGRDSALNPSKPIEGIVWHGDAGFGGKLKRKDFK